MSIHVPISFTVQLLESSVHFNFTHFLFADFLARMLAMLTRLGDFGICEFLF